MSARRQILSAIRARRTRSDAKPARWHQPHASAALVGHFRDRARAATAQVTELASAEEIPACVAELLRARNLPAIVHLPPDPFVNLLPWHAVPGLTLKREAPGPDDSALAIVPFAIAETGTLVYPSAPARPASWHFRAGLEIAVVTTDSIAPDLETVFARLKSAGSLSSTINLVTGPSRTGDIEQTLELGAHGPKELIILIVLSRSS